MQIDCKLFQCWKRVVDTENRYTVSRGFNINQWGAIKKQELSGIDNGEQMFVFYYQCILISVIDSTRFFDPRGVAMEKVNQNIIVHQ